LLFLLLNYFKRERLKKIVRIRIHGSAIKSGHYYYYFSPFPLDNKGCFSRYNEPAIVFLVSIVDLDLIFPLSPNAAYIKQEKGGGGCIAGLISGGRIKFFETKHR